MYDSVQPLTVAKYIENVLYKLKVVMVVRSEEGEERAWKRTKCLSQSSDVSLIKSEG